MIIFILYTVEWVKLAIIKFGEKALHWYRQNLNLGDRNAYCPTLSLIGEF